MAAIPKTAKYIDTNEPDTRRGKYYTTVISSCGRKFQRLSGPYKTHQAALDAVETDREQTVKQWPESVFCSFGTIRESLREPDRKVMFPLR